MKRKSCICILPFYNESPRILSVLSVLKKIDNLDQIICVDDGSTDNGVEVISQKFPDVQVIRLEKNKGKSAAVAEGLKKTEAEYVLLMDADLHNLQADELMSGIDKILRDPTIDMIIFRRKNDPWMSKIVRGDVLVSGERVLKSEDLRSIFKEKMIAYQIEPAINFYMQRLGKKVYWRFHSGTNVLKIKKVGFLSGLTKELDYFVSVLTYKGPIAYFSNVVSFCWEEVR